MLHGLILTAHAQVEGDAVKEKSGKEAKASDKKEKAKAEDAPVMADGLGTFGQLLPLGRKNLDVQIPSFRDGVPSSVVKANSMTRVSDTIMSMERMDIWLYGDNRDEDMRVQLPLADYNMESKVLSSDERSRISRNDFQLEGDHLIFDTVTQQGKLTGRVQMVIFNASGLAAGKAESGEAKEKTPEDAAKTDSKSSSETNSTPNSAQPSATGKTPSPNDQE